MNIIVEKIEDVVTDENWHGGGYSDGDCIYISSALTPLERRFTAYHEIIHAYCKGRVRHAIVDKIVKDLVDADRQLDMTLCCDDNKEEA